MRKTCQLLGPTNETVPYDEIIIRRQVITTKENGQTEGICCFQSLPRLQGYVSLSTHTQKGLKDHTKRFTPAEAGFNCLLVQVPTQVTTLCNLGTPMLLQFHTYLDVFGRFF
jgi:hypothetical protein